MIEVYDPGNRELVGTVPSASREGAAHAIHAMTDLKTYCYNL
jgi:hypothetical protein